MNKIVKRLAVSLVVLFALLGAGGVVAFASGYIEWGGSDDYRTVSSNLDEILKLGNQLQSELKEEKAKSSNLTTEVSNLKTEIDNKDTTISEQNETIKSQKITIAQLETEINGNIKQYEDLKIEFSKFITDINSKNGLRAKFDKMQIGANHLAGLTGINERVNDVSGEKAEDNQLKQAEEDMEELKEKSESVLDAFTNDSGE